MSLFQWFSNKLKPAETAHNNSGSAARNSQSRSQSSHDKPGIPLPARIAPGPAVPSGERKLQRHARREQLYVAVREAFTHSGVLSSTYKFKVLSLDQTGNEFMVMVDVDQTFDHRAEKLASIEEKVVQTAKTCYEVCVASVYWRIHTTAALRGSKPAPASAAKAVAAPDAEAASQPPKKPPGFRYDPIQDDEVAAFKTALLAASTNSPASADTTGKARSSRSYTLLTGFEDTEMPDSARTPALSATQYGDLN